MENYFNNKSLLQILSKWKYHILVLALVAAVGSGIASFLIKEKFKSVAVVYPVNLGIFSEESESEQMQQILQSQYVKDNVFAKFNLGNHYGLDSSYQYFYSTLNYMYDKNVSIRKTEYESVEIEVLDTDPKMACNIALSILEFYNEKVSEMHKQKYQELVDIKANEMARKEVEIGKFQDEMREYGTKYGIIHYDLQVEELTKGYVRFLADGKENSKSLEEIRTVLDNIKDKGGRYKELTSRLWNEIDSYNKLKNAYDAAYEEVKKEITYAQVVTSPFAADKKAYPVRWVIVVLTVISTLFLSIIVIGIIESRKK